jgi:hypothetical protein
MPRSGTSPVVSAPVFPEAGGACAASNQWRRMASARESPVGPHSGGIRRSPRHRRHRVSGTDAIVTGGLQVMQRKA